MMRLLLFAFCFLVGTYTTADALTGNAWRPLPEGARRLYVAGVIDTWQWSTRMTEFAKKKSPGYAPQAVESMLLPAMTCIHDKMTYEQAMGVVEKYMTQNPEDWHHEMADLVWMALSSTCPGPGKK
jgi:hypothetical protein